MSIRYQSWLAVHLCCPVDTSTGKKPVLVLLVILLVLAFGAFPEWPSSRGWGYYPSSGLGLILVIVLIVMLLNRGI